MNKKLLLSIFFVIFLVLPLASATDFTGLDNYKRFDKDIGKYGKIEIYDTEIFSQDSLLIENLLTFNTDQCLIDCKAELEFNDYDNPEGVLVQDIRFIGRDGKTMEVPYQIYLEYEEEYTYEVNDMETESCTGYYENINGTSGCLEYTYDKKQLTGTRTIKEEIEYVYNLLIPNKDKLQKLKNVVTPKIKWS